MNTTLLKTLAVVFATVLFVSCDNDYNSIGGDIIGNSNYDYSNGEDFPVKAYNAKIGPVQTNNLPLHQLGYLVNDKFETTTANFVTQLDLVDEAPVFINPSTIIVDSVVVTVPYFSKKISLESSGRGVYRLDSIHSKNNTIDPIGLKVYRNGFALNDFDASNPSVSAQYYSNQEPAFDAVKQELLYDDPTFVPNAKEFVKYKVKDLALMPRIAANVESRSSPRMRLKLDNAVVKNIIFDNANATSNLASKEAFKNYFKGLYFKTETAPTGSGSLMMLDFAKGNLTVYYKQDKSILTPGVRVMKEMVMNFTGNNVNLFNHTNDVYSTLASEPVGSVGHQNLYLKGGEGSATFIELFPDSTELEDLWKLNQTKGVLVNEASLTFTVNEEASGVGSGYKFNPNRVYLYNADTGERLFDYTFDSSVNSILPKYSKSIFGGIINKVEDKFGNVIKTVYKIRITEHIANLINSKTLEKLKENNVRLGLVISEDINKAGNAMLKAPQSVLTSTGADKKIIKYPIAAVINPLGTIFYGNLNSGNPKYESRVRFKISYSKPN
ncbi:MAG: DUF4270 domain-containing protein [Flavobacterium sp.]|nr:DUF4270 domain-containing protein [Flavobacterium sp.]